MLFFQVNGSYDLVALDLDLIIVFVGIPYIAEHLNGLALPVVVKEPSGAFRDAENKEYDNLFIHVSEVNVAPDKYAY